MSTRSEELIGFVSERGWEPQPAENGDVLFRFNDESYVLSADEQDPTFFKLTYPHMWEPTETSRSWDAINSVNMRVKSCKVGIGDKVLIITVESYMIGREDYREWFQRALDTIQLAKALLREELSKVRASGGSVA